MNFFLVSFNDGNSIKTGFNGTLEDAKKYYLNQSFEITEEKTSICVDVKQLKI
jgi:hypothetical protein